MKQSAFLYQVSPSIILRNTISLFLSLLLGATITVSCSKTDDRFDFEWPVSTASAEGMDQQKLDSAYLKADELGFVDALLVIRNGNLIAEEYYNGYLWWLGKINGYDMFMAMGMGGQYIINFPDLDLTVVTTTNKDISWDNDQEIPTLEIVSDYILTAIN
ncbi:MAG: hypothetical protein A2V64_00680 [Bacteroidetes bacterium RBG_13_43_22]|nr:MAG: hypothetical protein A2V64_00680 [Bacteroidetes bacterium RBG_13_43_22]